MNKILCERASKIVEHSECSNDTGIGSVSFIESFVLNESDLNKTDRQKSSQEYKEANNINFERNDDYYFIQKQYRTNQNHKETIHKDLNFKLNQITNKVHSLRPRLKDQFEINESSIKQKRKLQIQNIIFNHKSDKQNKILLDLISNLSKLGVQKRSKLNNINSLTQQESKFSNIFYQSPMIFCDENLTEKKTVNEQLYSDLMSGYKRDISVPKFELQKARLKKESLENEIDLLENQLKMKRSTDLHSPTMDTNLNISFESNRKVGYDDLMKLTNERDFYKQKFSFEATQRDVENKELRNQLCKIREELALEQKSSRDKMTRLEEDLKQANNRFETTLMEKEEFSSKVKHLENKIASLQYEVSRREKESYGKEFLENTEKHLTNLCQTLTVQLEDVKFQLRVAEEKIKRSEAELNSKEEKINCYSNQIENLKKEMEQSSDSYQKMKRAYEEQLSVYLIKEKEFCEIKDQMIKEKEDEISDLRAQLTDAKNFKMNSQQIQDALIEDYKRTISKQDEEIRALQESLKQKNAKFDSFQRELELSIGSKLDDRMRKEKAQWEQEQNFIIKRELMKVNEEKMREMARIQDELVVEKEKYIFEKDRANKYEKQIDELNQELKFSNKEKNLAITRAKESLKVESEKLKAELLNNKQEEINKYKKIINELEEELQKLKIEQYQSGEKNKENALNVEKIEKALVKDINEELRKLSSLIPGQLPKIVSFSNLRASFPAKFTENSLTLSTFQMAFNNLRNLLDEVSQSFQSLKTESEQVKRVNARLIQEKDEELEMIKKKCEKQKQKELESIREFINKDNDFSSNYNNEINSLVNALKNKDKEIKEIQDNMAEWKKETLTKLADKFEIELNRELDKRMKEYKEEASNHQNQLEKLRKEIDNLMKECRQNNANQISQEQHERMIRYLQSRLNDLRDENLVLRDRYKSTNLIQSNIGANNYASSFGENEFQSRTNIIYNQSISKNPFLQDDDNLVSSMYSSSIDGDENLESRNEILQQKLKELQKLQVQLDNVQA